MKTEIRARLLAARFRILMEDIIATHVFGGERQGRQSLEVGYKPCRIPLKCQNPKCGRVRYWTTSDLKRERGKFCTPDCRYDVAGLCEL